MLGRGAGSFVNLKVCNKEVRSDVADWSLPI